MYAPIDNPSVFIRPSDKLAKYIRTIKHESAPLGIREFTSKRPEDTNRKPKDIDLLLNDSDRKFLMELTGVESSDQLPNINGQVHESTKLVNLEDLQWVYEHLIKQNETSSEKLYLHELFKGSEIVLPKNKEVPRNPELEKRCQMLRIQQENLVYQSMTKNVDSSRRKLPEDTISYQLKQINRHMIAIAQFIMSVLAGFAFGFIGIELITGNLDFGFRLLLGIICALVIALAELYFLAKKLNEELVVETKVVNEPKFKTS